MIKESIAISMIVLLTFTQWFWHPVPTPIGILIILAIFPPTLLINAGIVLIAKFSDTNPDDFKRGK